MKKGKDPLLTLQAITVSAIKRGLDLTTDLEKSGLLPSWHLDLWQHLISEFMLEHKGLVEFREAANIRASAWTTRNILELTIWVSYCAKSQINAKCFYDDRVRDTFDLLEHAEALSGLSDESDVSIPKLVEETRRRILKQAQADNSEDADKSFQRVYDAAATIGQDTLYRSLNKILSKFAHPTSMMVFSFQDEASARQDSTIFLVIGSALCLSAMTEFQGYVKTLSHATRTTDPDI